MLSYPSRSRKKKSKKLFALTTIAAALVFIGSYFVFNSSNNEKVIAKINGQKIYQPEIEQKLRYVLEEQGATSKAPELDKLPKEIIEILAKEVYLEKELTKEAIKSGVAKRKEVQAKIENTKNKIIRQSYIDSILQNEITESKVNDKYLELSKELEGKKEYKIFHIVVSSKEKAEKIVEELKSKKGKNKFADFAKKYSIDQETADKGGEIDYTLEDGILKEIAAVISTLDKDSISDPIQTKFGWHIVKVGDIRAAKALSFEEVKNNIRDQLIQDRVNEINNKIINNAKVQLLIQLKETDKSAKIKSESENKIVAPDFSEDQKEKNTEEKEDTVNSRPEDLNEDKSEQIVDEKEVEAKADENKNKNAKSKKYKKTKS